MILKALNQGERNIERGRERERERLRERQRERERKEKKERERKRERQRSQRKGEKINLITYNQRQNFTYNNKHKSSSILSYPVSMAELKRRVENC